MSPSSDEIDFPSGKIATARLSHKIGIYGLDDEESSPGSQKSFKILGREEWRKRARGVNPEANIGIPCISAPS